MSVDKLTIKSQLSLSAVIEFGMNQPIPRNRFINCPFHADRNSSLKIYDDHFHCFSCHKHGDVIEWVKLHEGCDFKTALQICNELLLHANH